MHRGQRAHCEHSVLETFGACAQDHWHQYRLEYYRSSQADRASSRLSRTKLLLEFNMTSFELALLIQGRIHECQSGLVKVALSGHAGAGSTVAVTPNLTIEVAKREDRVALRRLQLDQMTCWVGAVTMLMISAEALRAAQTMDGSLPFLTSSCSLSKGQ